MKTARYGAMTVVTAVVISLAGLWLVRTLWPAVGLIASNEIGDSFITVLGSAYGVLIAFMISAVWSRYTEADRNADTEANQILALANVSRILGHPSSPRFIHTVLAYGHSLVEDEWPLLARGKGSERSRRLLQELWDGFADLAAGPIEREFVLAEALARLEDLTDSRRLRLFNCDDAIPTVLWDLLVFEGTITVVFTYLLVAPTALIQGLMTVALTATIATSLYLIQVLDRPFRGGVHISSENLRSQLVQWEQAHPEFVEAAGG